MENIKTQSRSYGPFEIIIVDRKTILKMLVFLLFFFFLSLFFFFTVYKFHLKLNHVEDLKQKWPYLIGNPPLKSHRQRW